MELLIVNNISRSNKYWTGFFSVLVAFLSPLTLIDSATADDLKKLKQIQSLVQKVVETNLKATVAVTDGIGFGSGVIVSEDGLVMTAGHVLTTGGTDFKVIFPNGRTIKARMLGKNLNVDAGMMQLLEKGPYPFVELGDARKLSRGDWCVCLGHSGGYSLGRQPPVRTGRILDFEPDVIVTDCALIGGDSGGPLFDITGKLIGIHSNIGTSVAENRHVSVNTFQKYWQRLKRGDSWGSLPELEVQQKPRAAMGIRLDMESDVARILIVHDGGSAQAAGMQADDVVYQYDDVQVNSPNHLIDLVKQNKPGEEVKISFRRGDQELNTTVRLQMLGK